MLGQFGAEEMGEAAEGRSGGLGVRGQLAGEGFAGGAAGLFGNRGETAVCLTERICLVGNSLNLEACGHPVELVPCISK